jgi:hypothetical protein
MTAHLSGCAAAREEARPEKGSHPQPWARQPPRDPWAAQLAELKPAPDQVTIAIGTAMMDLIQMWSEDDIKGTHLESNEKALQAWAGLWASCRQATHTLNRGQGNRFE